MSEPLSNDGAKPPAGKSNPDDINDFFALTDDEKKADDKKDKDEEDKPPVKKEKKDKDNELDDEDDEIKLKDDEDDDEDKLDLDEDKDKKEKKGKDEEEIEIDVPPKKREILAKYPNFFKEYPFFEKMMFRDRQYTELFGSFDDAKDIAERAQVLDNFESDLLKGSTEKILSKVKEVDKKAFDKLVDGYLPTLFKVDKEAYFEVVGNVSKQIIKELVEEAKGKLGTNKEAAQLLNQAALTLNQFLFGTDTYSPPRARIEKPSEESSELENEKRSFIQERFDTARTELQSKVDNTLRATITEYIDRNSEMSAYVKKNAVRDALLELHKTIGTDTAFRKNLDRLWEAAFADKFSKGSTDKIRSMYLGKAKNLLPAIIKKARAEALKDSTPSARREKDEEEERPTRRGPIDSGRPRQSGGKSNKMEKGESVAEFFARD